MGAGIGFRSWGKTSAKRCLRRERPVARHEELIGEAEFDALRLWVQKTLSNSTKALASEGVSPFICEDVCAMLSQMKRGCEQEHLRLLYRVMDSRGSDVRLNFGAILDGVRQLALYLAFAWGWASVQSYPWVTPQHINAMELLAFSTI